MIVLICGGRDYVLTARDVLALTRLHADIPVTLLITGGARGVDRAAETWARSHRIPVRVMAAEWHVYGPAAGPIRNRAMLVELQRHSSHTTVQVWAFPGGKGTDNMVQHARHAGVEVVLLGETEHDVANARHEEEKSVE